MKLLILTLALSFNALSHGGHGIPGAIPPALNGGTLGEAKHIHGGSGSHDLGKAHTREIFFEVILEKDTLKVYPLELDPVKHKSFNLLPIEKFKIVKVQVIDPRKNKLILSELKTIGDHWEGELKGTRGRRFIIKILTQFNGGNYKGQIQVEKR